MYANILVPVDGSVPASLGLQEAIKLAQSLNARISLIHVVDVYPLLTSEAVGASFDETLFDMLRRKGAEVLKQAAAAVTSAGIMVDAALVEAADVQVGECIVRQAREYHAELIVCGTHGRRGIRRLLMGSDAEYIVRHAPVPVLLVQAHHSEAAKKPAAGAG
jgi:nucleotide-binding universal stress UspA family protein